MSFLPLTEDGHEGWVVEHFPLGADVLHERTGAGKVDSYFTAHSNKRTLLHIKHEGDRYSWATPGELKRLIGRERVVTHCVHGIRMAVKCPECDKDGRVIADLVEPAVVPDKPVVKRGGHQPIASGPAPTIPPAPTGPKPRRF